MDMVVLDNVSKIYRIGDMDLPALVDASLRIREGTFAALVGPSGSGKTTALNLIGCLDIPSSGTLAVAGQDVSRLNRREAAAFRGDKLGFIFQDFSLLPVLSVYENVEYPLLMIQDIPKAQRKAAVLSEF